MPRVFSHVWNVLTYIQGISLNLAVETYFASRLEFMLTPEPSCSFFVEYGRIAILLKARVFVSVFREKIRMTCGRNIENLSDNACHLFISCMEGESGCLCRYLAQNQAQIARSRRISYQVCPRRRATKNDTFRIDPQFVGILQSLEKREILPSAASRTV